VNADDPANTFGGQLFTDGVNSPSEFTGNPHSLGDMIDGTDRPQCEFDMSCSYCTTDCDGLEVPSDFQISWTPPQVDTGYDQECLAPADTPDSGDSSDGGDDGGAGEGGDDGDDGDEGDWEWDDDEHGFDDWDGNFEDDDGSNDYTQGCVPDSFEGEAWGHVINV